MGFMQTYQMVITPLSPIHLGTGEDFLPTNYVIDNGVLYEFDPASAVLNQKEINELAGASNSSDIKQVYQFFKNNPRPFRACAYRVVGISNKVASDYKEKLGQNVQANNPNGNRRETVINDLSIACTSTNPQTHLPVIYGSAFKGCVRTAVLNDLCEKKYTDNKQMQTDLLGSFDKDMFSAFKPSDLTAISHSIDTYASYAYQYKKHGENKQGAIPIRIETIAPAQYRSFSGSLNIYLEKNTDKKLPDIKEMVKMLNNYHIAIWDILKQQNIVNEEWRINTTNLLQSLQTQFNAGKVALIRLGKLCGAESKTLPQVAKIKIMRGRGQSFDSPTTTTIWLTEDQLPLGWALLEIQPSVENTELKTWCENNNHIVKTIKQAIENAEKEDKKLQETLAKQQAEEQQRKEKEAAEKAEKERMAQEEALAEEQRRASLSDFERVLEDWQKRLKECSKDNSQNIFDEFKQFLQNAVSQYPDDDCKKLARQFNKREQEQYKNVIFGKRSDELKPLLAKLRGE